MTRSIRKRWSDARRAWKAGPGVVDKFETGSGHDTSTYNPSEYGDYLVTSNAVYTCANIRADACASVAMKSSRFDANGKKIPDRDSEVVRLLQKVNQFWTMNRLMKMTELSLCTWGMNYWAVEKDGRGNPVELWWMRTDRVVIMPDPVNYVKGFVYCPTNGEKPIPFGVDEVIWFRYPNPLDEYSGLSPMAAARLAADVASEAGKSNLGIFKNGYQVGGLIVPKEGFDMTSDQAKELEKQLDSRFSGSDKAHKWGVLRLEVETKQLGITPKDAEFLGALGWSLEEIARAYGIPLDMVGGQRTYENVRASDRAFWMRTITPELNFIAS
jgi:HK97 family phage portal protein